MTAVAACEQFCRVGGIEICFEEIGDPNDPPLLLIMGLGMQMIAWPDEFCEQLAATGLRVIRFDNRDCGRSTHLARHPAAEPLVDPAPAAAAGRLHPR